VPRDEEVLAALERDNQVALRYAAPPGVAPAPASGALPAGAGYPYNPNGSAADIAGVCNPAGTVFGLMPHPEDHIFPEQHPRWTRGERGNLGLALFRNGISYAAQV
jgi:phosphoribosylformylglycinamidine synthase